MKSSDVFQKKEQRCQERINRRKQEAALMAETEKAKTALDVGLLNLHLQNEKIYAEDTEEEQDQYLSAHSDRIQKYPIPNASSEKKGLMTLYGVMFLDFVAGFVTMGAIISEGLIAMVASSFLAAALFYIAGSNVAITQKEPDVSDAEKSVASVLQLCVFFLVFSMSVLRFIHAAEGEGIATSVFLFVLMIALGSVAYLITYAICAKLYQTKATRQYHALRIKAEQHDLNRLEHEGELVDRKKSLEDFLLENELQLNQTIERMEDELDGDMTQTIQINQQQTESAKAQKESDAFESLQKQLQNQQQSEAEVAAQKKRDRRRQRLGLNGLTALLVMLIAFSGCDMSSPSTIQSIFIDPSGGAANVIDVLGTGEEVLATLGNNLEQPTAAHGQVDVFIMQEQTGMERYSVSTPVLTVTASLEQKKTRKDLQGFLNDWENMKQQIQFPEDGYNQSRIVKPLFEVIDYTLGQPHSVKQVVLHTDLLEHTEEMSFLRMKPKDIRKESDEIMAFLDHYCQCETLAGVDIQFAYQSRTESKYDQHRVEIEKIFQSYFTNKGATISRFHK